jgi:hypothetical protein
VKQTRLNSHRSTTPSPVPYSAICSGEPRQATSTAIPTPRLLPTASSAKQEPRPGAQTKKEACGILKSATATFTSADLGSPISETTIVKLARFFEPTTVKAAKSSTEVELSVTAKAGSPADFSVGREGEKYTVTHDIFLNAVTPNKDASFGACVRECLFDYLASEDKSANETVTAGSAHHVIEWAPKWEGTTWNPLSELEEGKVPKPPTGYVLEGLTFEAGYQGGGGP